MGEWVIVETAEAPTRTEIIAVGMDANGIIAGQMWNGSSWTAFSFNNLVDLTTSTNWSFDVAYEQQSGRAMLVWDNGTTGTASISYRIWDGAAWSNAQTITTPLSGEARQLRLAADPGSNELVLVASNASSQDYALVWNGSSWGNSVTLESTTTAENLTDVSVAYESHSGDAMVVYGNSTSSVYYRVWDGSTWSSESSLAQTGITGNVKWTTLASDPTSDRIALGVLTSSNEVWFSVWDGSAWGSKTTATTSAPATPRRQMAVAFERSTSQLLAAWGISGNNAVQYNTWSVGGGWGTAASGPNIVGVPNMVLLSPDPNSDDIMLGTQIVGSDVNYTLWNGSAWGTPTADMTGDTGTATGMPLDFVWFDNNRAPVINPAAFSTPENSTAVGTVTATDADGNPLVYSIIGGADAAKFTIGASTGLLSFVTAPDYESPTDSGGNNVYDVIIKTSDQTGGTDSQAIAVTVTNLNEAPTFTSGAGTGKVTTSVSSFWDGASATLIQPDGKIVVAGSMNNGSTSSPTWRATTRTEHWIPASDQLATASIRFPFSRPTTGCMPWHFSPTPRFWSRAMRTTG